MVSTHGWTAVADMTHTSMAANGGHGAGSKHNGCREVSGTVSAERCAMDVTHGVIGGTNISGAARIIQHG